MTLPNVRPVNEWTVDAYTPSAGTAPAAANCVAPVKGRVVRTYAVANGATTGTMAIAVGINGGADIGTGALAISAGSGGIAASDLPTNSGGSAQLNEGDVITFTPSGASGASVPAQFTVVIREG
ncbi:MAG TPA: hypothetical protein VKW08_15070 [Xanthobacteraceae bacterium]|nr:hypothetical protein [Xanthobacteraceae bacterium]